MNIYKQLTVTIAIVGVLGGIVVSQAFATQNQNNNGGTQEQSQDQKLKVICEVGAYGQASKCVAEGEQRQYQKQVLGAATQIVYRDGKLNHKMVDTALDMQTTIAAAGIMLSGVGAYALKRKIG
jgi:hypothetical protein